MRAGGLSPPSPLTLTTGIDPAEIAIVHQHRLTRRYVGTSLLTRE